MTLYKISVDFMSISRSCDQNKLVLSPYLKNCKENTCWRLFPFFKIDANIAYRRTHVSIPLSKKD